MGEKCTVPVSNWPTSSCSFLFFAYEKFGRGETMHCMTWCMYYCIWNPFEQSVERAKRNKIPLVHPIKLWVIGNKLIWFTDHILTMQYWPNTIPHRNFYRPLFLVTGKTFHLHKVKPRIERTRGRFINSVWDLHMCIRCFGPKSLSYLLWPSLRFSVGWRQKLQGKMLENKRE